MTGGARGRDPLGHERHWWYGPVGQALERHRSGRLSGRFDRRTTHRAEQDSAQAAVPVAPTMTRPAPAATRMSATADPPRHSGYPAGMSVSIAFNAFGAAATWLPSGCGGPTAAATSGILRRERRVARRGRRGRGTAPGTAGYHVPRPRARRRRGSAGVRPSATVTGVAHRPVPLAPPPCVRRPRGTPRPPLPLFSYPPTLGGDGAPDRDRGPFPVRRRGPPPSTVDTGSRPRSPGAGDPSGTR